MGYRKDHNGLSMRGKAGFSDEYLDKLDSETRDSLQENGDASGGQGEPDLRWERLRLSDGDLLSASRDPEFEKLKVESANIVIPSSTSYFIIFVLMTTGFWWCRFRFGK
jgi:hypothetical protein